ncbi:hypothetical protein LY78DRAFT_376145 [Colletotrichum sublineola]|nr:hypothetical protein LY78DRAFT_376145 [Colletotrichum sublineola]
MVAKLPWQRWKLGNGTRRRTKDPSAISGYHRAGASPVIGSVLFFLPTALVCSPSDLDNRKLDRLYDGDAGRQWSGCARSTEVQSFLSLSLSLSLSLFLFLFCFPALLAEPIVARLRSFITWVHGLLTTWLFKSYSPPRRVTPSWRCVLNIMPSASCHTVPLLPSLECMYLCISDTPKPACLTVYAVASWNRA